MPLEIERKFLVQGEPWRSAEPGIPYTQGYMLTGPPTSVRVRIAGTHGYVTIKGDRGPGVRLEYEYEIPVGEAREMLDALCTGHTVEKTRYRVAHHGHTWEVDVFHGENAGLVVAEIELDAPDAPFDMPPWLAAEVTHDRRYLNSYLSHHPFTTWE